MLQGTSLPLTPTRDAQAGKQVVGLDAIRVMAALLVVGYHFGSGMWSYHSKLPHAPAHAFNIFRSYINFGWVGVEVFFVLSGFVIAYSAYSASAFPFLRQRLVRLVPGMLLCATFSATVMLSLHAPLSITAGRFVHSVFFLPGTTYIDDAHWTLPLEMSFYLLCFLLLLFRQIAKLAPLMAGLGVISTLYNISTTLHAHLSPRILALTVTLVDQAPFHQALFLRYACYFTLGVFLWLGMFQSFTWQRTAVLLVTFVGAVFQILSHAREISQAQAVAIPSVSPILAWIAALILIVLSIRHNLFIHGLVGTRGIVLLRQAGLVTYPLYLIHLGFGKLLTVFLIHVIGPFPALACALTVVLLLAYAVAIFLEPVGQRLLRTFLIRSGEAVQHVNVPAHFQTWVHSLRTTTSSL